MFTANTIDFVSLQWNEKLSLTTITVSVGLANGDKVTEEYGILGVERDELREGRIYGVVGYKDNLEHRGIVGVHPVSPTRFASQVKDVHEFWQPVVREVAANGGFDRHGLHLYGMCSHLELAARIPTLL